MCVCVCAHVIEVHEYVEREATRIWAGKQIDRER
jgi:hypothetical protein